MDFFSQEKVSAWTRYGAPASVMGDDAYLIWREDDPEAFDSVYPGPSQSAMTAGFETKYATNLVNKDP